MDLLMVGVGFLGMSLSMGLILRAMDHIVRSVASEGTPKGKQS